MEIGNIELRNDNFYIEQGQLNFRCYKFEDRERATHQRLIPLTEDIVKTMADFNATPSTTSISDKHLYKTFSITSVVREEVYKILQELSAPEKYIRQEDIDTLIEKCLLKAKAPVSSGNLVVFDEAHNEDILGILNENEKNKLIVENFQLLEHRISNVEKRISGIMDNIPELKSKKFKFNPQCIKDEVYCLMEKMKEQNTEDNDLVMSVLMPKEGMLNKYDNIIFKERKENIFNLLNYKKSLTTLKLNEKVHFNPYVKPILLTLPDYRNKIKQRTTFIRDNIFN